MQNCANNFMQKNKYTPYFSTDKASTFAVRSVNLVLHCQGEIALSFSSSWSPHTECLDCSVLLF